VGGGDGGVKGGASKSIITKTKGLSTAFCPGAVSRPTDK